MSPRRVYERSLRIDPRRLGFILMDMQDGFLEVLPPEVQHNLIETNKRLLRYCAADDIPVAVVEFDCVKAGTTAKGMTHIALQQELLHVKRKKLIYKDGPDGFRNSNDELDKFLKYHSVQRIGISGIYAEHCIRSTILTGAYRYRMFTSEDLISVRANESTPRDVMAQTTHRQLAQRSTIYQDLDQILLCEFSR